MASKRVTVYCASSSRVDKEFLTAAEKLGRLLARNEYVIIYGGGKAGLMGKLSDGASAEGGRVIGVIPDFMMNMELGNDGISELRVVKDMHARQAMMLHESDLIVTLPGGSGSMLEFFEAISWKRLGLIISPIILVNLRNYYAPILKMLDQSIKERFMAKEYAGLWHITETIEETVELILSLSS